MINHKKTLVSVLPAMVVPAGGALFYFVILSGSNLSVVVYFLTKLFMLIWPWAIFMMVEKRKVISLFKDPAVHVKSIPWGFLLGGVMALFIWSMCVFTRLGDYVQGYASMVQQKANDMQIYNHYVAFAIFVSLGHSLLEEYYWRWFVFGRLRQFINPVSAGLWASLAFAAHHYVILGGFFSAMGAIILGSAVGLGGALWCWMYHRQKTLIGCWICHALVDAAILYIGYKLIFCPAGSL